MLLACGGSDEPTNLPDSERATDEPTTEGAEPSPTPRATAAPTPAATAAPRETARPPMAQTSPETDWKALVALYNATGGADWERSDNWLTDAPISDWEGVTTDDNGRVAELSLNKNQLSGEIPPELGNLENLWWLDLGYNQLTGCVPSSSSGRGRLDMDRSDLGDLPFCP